MLFENYTSFPAIGWLSWDNKAKEYNSIVVRVKYLFDQIDKEGLWSLKLDPNQGELFGTDIFYEENMSASVLFESDYIAYKPHADLVVNGFAHSDEPKRYWDCGIKAIRPLSDDNHEVLVEQNLTVTGERYWRDGFRGWRVSRPQKTTKVALRYENAYGGVVLDPNKEGEYLKYYHQNPIGKGIFHKSLIKQNIAIEAPQIEAKGQFIEQKERDYTPQGLGFIHRSWQPRLALAGTFDNDWLENKHPVMPDDFQESHNNGANPNLQLKDRGYFEVGDIIILENLLKGKSVQAFILPDFHFKAEVHIANEKLASYLDIDTVVVDIRADEMSDNAIYISYRKRISASKHTKKITLDMIVSEEFIEKGREDG
ncbi:putative exported protein [hydrothermal vent metagenome]|uniref:Putative exported protein n=1 Tax=hydrothermal vent metagenome TaxID=652676 RepID=A0A1W1BCZ2_9ZZZZ